MKRIHLLIAFLLMAFICFAVTATAADKPSIKIKPYGFFKLDGMYDQNETNGNVAKYVGRQNGDDSDEQFNMTPKHTRLGLKMTGENIRDAAVNGKVEVDFYGSDGPENAALIRLRHAYFTVRSAEFQLLAGQTWDLISPLNPSMLNASPIFGAGNIGMRRPQVRLSYTAQPNNQTDITLAAGIFRNMGNDNTPTLTLSLADGEDATDGSDDGTDAGIPSIQGMLELRHEFNPGTSLQVGASGLWGQMKAESQLSTNTETYENWGAVGHLKLSLASGFAIMGEGFTGRNLGSYAGGISQASTLDGVDCVGGWGSLQFQPSDQVQFNAGGGMDDPKDEDLSNGDKGKNQCIFGNIKYNVVPLVTLGLEVSHWRTEYLGDADPSDNLRVQTSFILNF